HHGMGGEPDAEKPERFPVRLRAADVAVWRAVLEPAGASAARGGHARVSAGAAQLALAAAARADVAQSDARVVNASRWQTWLAAARPRTLPAAVAPVIVGSTLAWRDDRFDARAAALCGAFALLVQIGTNFANDYYDFVKGADNAARV